MAAPINPKGAKSDKIWRDAIMRAVRRPESGKATKKTQRLEQLADKLVEQGLDGEVTALKEIGDRLDGKPNQTISGDAESPLTFVLEAGKSIDAKLERLIASRSRKAEG